MNFMVVDSFWGISSILYAHSHLNFFIYISPYLTFLFKSKNIDFSYQCIRFPLRWHTPFLSTLAQVHTIAVTPLHHPTCHVKIVINCWFQKHPHPPHWAYRGGLTFWILVANSDPNIMKIVLVNILGILDGRCDFFGVCLFSGWKNGGVKKKVPKNCVFLCFFQKMNIFWPILKFSNFVIFVNEAHKQVSDILSKRF